MILVNYKGAGNVFRDHIKGIDNRHLSLIAGKGFEFYNIRKECILSYKGTIQITECIFENFGRAGVVDAHKFNVEVTHSTFRQIPRLWTEDISMGIYVKSEIPGAQFLVNNCEIDGDLGTDLSKEFKGIECVIDQDNEYVYIDNNTIKVNGANCDGISSVGLNLNSELVVIKNNDVYVSGGFDQESFSWGINTFLGNNTYVSDNTFNSHHFIDNVNIVNDNKEIQRNVGLGVSSYEGKNNFIQGNIFLDDIQKIARAISISTIHYSTVCQNHISYDGIDSYGSNLFDASNCKGVSFNGICKEMTFGNNSFLMYGNGWYVNSSLQLYFMRDIGVLVWEGSVSGTHTRSGNLWLHKDETYNLPDGTSIPPTTSFQHAQCQSAADAPFNRFVVQTLQSTCDETYNPCFNVYHPRNVFPDNNDEFFKYEAGNVENCPYVLPPVGIDQIDIDVVTGDFPEREGFPYLPYELKRLLFSKLDDFPNLKNSRVDMESFYITNENSSLGKLSRAFKEFHGNQANQTVRNQVENLNSNFLTILSDIKVFTIQLDENSTIEEFESLHHTFMQMHNILNGYSEISENAKVQRLQEFDNLIETYNTVSPSNRMEEIEKEVALTVLNAIINHESKLTNENIIRFEEIIENEPLYQSTKLYLKYLLPDCISDEFFKPVQHLEEETISVPRGLIDGKEDSSLKITPNPSSGEFVLSSTEAISSINIIGINGTSLFFSDEFKGMNTVNLNIGLPEGVYFAKIHLETGRSEMIKLVVTK